ncbi:MAG: permease [Sphingopyxis sp.]|nr:permease [Sphingopyxis sp.]
MDLYLPVANLSVNALVIILLGGGVGFLSGMFGVGGGFLTTPLLIFYGIPPTVAAASAATQVTGASVSGALAHFERDGVDVRMGGVLIAGGLLGSLIGAALFELLAAWGQIDTTINILYVVLLGSVGGIMAREALGALRNMRAGLPAPARKRRHHPMVANLPLRWRFYRSGLYISPLAPLLLGTAVGILTMLLGVGGGFIMVPAMLYLLGMGTQVVVGTSLFQILFVTIATTMVHAMTTGAVDIVLAGLLLLGSVTGAQIGARFAQRVKPEYLRMALAVIVLLVAARMAVDLFIRPEEIYTVQ